MAVVSSGASLEKKGQFSISIENSIALVEYAFFLKTVEVRHYSLTRKKESAINS